jgi:hypothetical protein
MRRPAGGSHDDDVEAGRGLLAGGGRSDSDGDTSDSVDSEFEDIFDDMPDMPDFHKGGAASGSNTRRAVPAPPPPPANGRGAPGARGAAAGRSPGAQAAAKPPLHEALGCNLSTLTRLQACDGFSKGWFTDDCSTCGCPSELHESLTAMRADYATSGGEGKARGAFIAETYARMVGSSKNDPDFMADFNAEAEPASLVLGSVAVDDLESQEQGLSQRLQKTQELGALSYRSSLSRVSKNQYLSERRVHAARADRLDSIRAATQDSRKTFGKRRGNMKESFELGKKHLLAAVAKRKAEVKAAFGTFEVQRTDGDVKGMSLCLPSTVCPQLTLD